MLERKQCILEKQGEHTKQTSSKVLLKRSSLLIGEHKSEGGKYAVNKKKIR